MADFKVKAIRNTGGSGFPIKKGMEVTVSKNGQSKPNGAQIRDAYNSQHNLELGKGTSINLGNFEIDKL